MQTFLPYASFTKSARCLDRLRLGKQRVEGYQILRTLTGVSDGWRQHPAVKMWAGYEHALWLYVQACIAEWERRGYTNNIVLPDVMETHVFPKWLGNEKFHASHRSNLLRKMPEHYGQFGWSDDPAAPYYWPTQETA